MIVRAVRYLKLMRRLQRVNAALARGAAGAATRRLDPADPLSWEFSGFSQNGEDGILDVLTRALREPTRAFVEVGASDFLENNTSWLALARKYTGLMIEGDPAKAAQAQELISFLELPLARCERMFVGRDSARRILELAPRPDPDVLSVDIDGNDWHVAKALLDAGLRPRIVAVEYNAAYGPEASLTIEYRDDFRIGTLEPTGLYAGASIMAWRKLLEGRGWRFVTVDSNGVNAFFVEPSAFEAGFVAALEGVAFRDNLSGALAFREPWRKRFERIKALPHVAV